MPDDPLPSPPPAPRLRRLLLAAPAVLAFVLLVLVPAWSAARFGRSVDAAPDSLLGEAARLDSLARRSAFLAARLAHADPAVPTLALDPADSTLWIEIGGVPVRRCRLTDVRISQAARRAFGPGTAHAEDGRGFTLLRATATVPKDPIREVRAPKDTTEASTRPPEEVPVETRTAYVTLRFDRHLTLRLRPPAASAGDVLVRTAYDLGERFAYGARASAALLRGEAPPVERTVTLTLSAEDARAVYRALPDSARLALDLPDL